jgi:hypothetical protein
VILLPYSVRQGALVHVSEVLSGAAGNFQCPAFQARIVVYR